MFSEKANSFLNNEENTSNDYEQDINSNRSLKPFTVTKKLKSESTPKGEASKLTEPALKSRRTRWGQSAAEAAAAKNEVTSSIGTAAEAAAAAATLAAQVKTNDVAARAATARAAVEKAKKALALQKQIQQQIRAMQPTAAATGLLKAATRSGISSVMASGVIAALRSLPSAKLLRFDRLGREIDAEGKVIEVKPLARSTLKVNINKERETKLKQATFQTRIDRNLTNPATNPWFDAALATKSKLRKRGLSFVERGFYTKKERLLRTRELAQTMGIKVLTPAAREEQKRREQVADAVLKRLANSQEQELESVTDQTPLKETYSNEDTNQVKLGITKKKPQLYEEEVEESTTDWTVYRQDALHLLQRKQVGIIPDVEWWDMPLLKKAASTDRFENENPEFPYIILESAITDLIEHPVSLPPIVDVTKPTAPVLYLTPKERAKLRRRKRQEKEKEKRDKIRMGLIPPPPPRVKLANLARVLGTSAALNPSKVEQSVREQVELRQRQHAERNEARKLDAESKRKKTISKWTKMPNESEIPIGGAEVCVFSVASLTNPVHLFKVDKNAQQFHVTGACIVCPHIGNLIIVEGSHKALKGYKKLLLRRIKWDTQLDGTKSFEFTSENQLSNQTTKKSTPHCSLLWQGIVKDRAFKQWKVYPCKSESEIKKILSDRNSDHYWEMFKKTRLET